MKASLEDHGTGWFGLTLELAPSEIDHLIIALKKVKEENSHFHFRSDWSGEKGIGDIEIACGEEPPSGGLTLESNPPIFPGK